MADVSGGTVKWDIDADTSKLSKGLSDARKETQQAAQDIDKSLGQISTSTKSIGESFQEFAQSAVVGATAITGALALIGKSALDSASQFQVARISFNTMIGDTKVAGEELAKLSDFAAKTPFTLPEVLQGAKQLMAMGSSTKELLPELKALGDVSAGLDVPMGRLIQNFGQVRTAGKLTGRELRDFNMAGVPLIDELVKQFNAQGGALVKVGATSGKTKEKMDSLNDSLTKQTNRLSEMTSKGKTSSAAYKNLNIDIQNTRDKIAGLGPATEGFSKRVKVTKKDIADMVSNGDISFDQVKQAFMSMTGEGGRFNNLMNELSQTLPGRISNLSDNFIRMGAAIMGVSTSGDVLAGGLFDRISTSAQALLDILNQITPQAQGFVQGLLENGPAVAAILGAILGLMTPLAIAFAALIAPALVFATVGAGLGFVLQTLIDKLGGWAAVQAVLQQGINLFLEVYNGIFKPALDSLWQTIQTNLVPQLQELWTMVSPVLVPALQVLGTILGGFLLGSFIAVIEILKLLITWVGYMVTKFTDLIHFFQGFPDLLRAALAGVTDAITKPFRDAWDNVKKFADMIKSEMDKVSPFHRNSPSLVDNVIAGVDIIKQKYASLGDISFPKISEVAGGSPDSGGGLFTGGSSADQSGSGMGGLAPSIVVNIGTVQNKSDIDQITKEIGFRASLLPTS